MREELTIRGGLVVTGGPDGIVVGDVVVEGERISGVGVEAAHGGREIDATGCLVIPGLVQAHVHLGQTLFRGLADDMDVIEWLRERIWPLEQAHDRCSVKASAALGIAELLTGGTTAALSMESVSYTDAVFEAAEELGIRATIGKALMDRWEPGTEMWGEETDEGWRDQIRLVETWHGAANGRIHVALSPRGPRNATVETWKRCVSLAEEADLRLHTHVNENKDQANLLGDSPEGRDVEFLAGVGALSERLVMAHAVWLSAKERDLVRASRPHVCHCPSTNLKLASGIAPVPGLLADGVNVALGADGAPANNRLDGFEEMRLAALIHKLSHGPRAVPAATVFEMATMGGARALGLAGEIGSLEVGKQADIVVVSRQRLHVSPREGGDPISELVYAHRASDVSAVVVAGQVVVDDSDLQSGSTEQIRTEAEKQRVAILERAEHKTR